MLFEDNMFDVNLSLFMPDVDFSRDNKILEPMEGFLRGNMFREEYEPYKNLSYFRLNPMNEKEKDLFNVMALSFAVNDLNLYLDLHPDNKEIFHSFKKYNEDLENATKDYEKNYGPLEITGKMGSKYTWIDSPWPWDSKGGSMYV